MGAMDRRGLPEAERRLLAAVERHGDAVSALNVGDRPDQAQHAAAKVLGRSVELVRFTLSRAADAGVATERLVELSGWDRSLVEAVIERGIEPDVVARIVPIPVVDPEAVAKAAASVEATARIGALLEQILADVEEPGWSPAAADLDELGDRLEHEWRAWQQGLGRVRS
jgi:hypothetical protein